MKIRTFKLITWFAFLLSIVRVVIFAFLDMDCDGMLATVFFATGKYYYFFIMIYLVITLRFFSAKKDAAAS